jgi:osmoprotectant transport system substrate-binding protein
MLLYHNSSQNRPTCLRLKVLAATLMLSLLLAQAAVAQTIRVGGKNFTEQVLIAELTSQLLTAKGYDVSSRTGLSSSGIRLEQEAGLVDIYWEYTGTALVSFNNVVERLPPEEAFRRVRDLDGRKGLIWLTPSKVNNTFALAMRRSDAEAKRIASISDLAAAARRGERFRLACTTEFFIRPDGLIPMERAYGFGFAGQDITRIEPGAVYDLLRDEQTDVGLVFATDGHIPSLNLLVLADDRGFFPSYLLAPVVRKGVLDRNPELATYLETLAERLDNATIASLNAQVDVQNKPAREVASSFLRSQGLL